MEDNHIISSRSRSAANIVTNNGSDLHGGHTGSYDSYFKSLPPGYRFKPTDEELVVSYLKIRIQDEPLPPNRINDIDLYKYDPEMLAEKYKSDGENMTWYFFTPRDKKYPNGIRPKRSVEDRGVKYGFWKATGADKPVMFKDVQVGCKTSLVYHTGIPPNGPKTDWKMHEYKIPKPEDNKRPRKKAKKNADSSRSPKKIDMRLDDWVLCRVFKKVQSLKASEHSNNNSVEIQEQPTDGSSSQDNGNVFDESDAPLANAYQQNHLLSNQDGYYSSYQSGFLNQNDMPIGYGGAFMAESLPGAILPYHNPYGQFNGSLKRKRSFCDLPSELDQYPNYVEWLINAADNDLTTNFP